MRILVIEDEPKVGKALQEALQAEDYDVTLSATGEEGFFLASCQPFDLIVLDILLPGRDGTEVLSTLRKRGMRIPVLMLTAKDAIEDRVAGLDAGADDYPGQALRRAGREDSRGSPPGRQCRGHSITATSVYFNKTLTSYDRLGIHGHIICCRYSRRCCCRFSRGGSRRRAPPASLTTTSLASEAAAGRAGQVSAASVAKTRESSLAY